MKRSRPPLRLRYSPLVYVIGQVRISPVVAIEKYIPEIQEQLRHKGFPRFVKGQIQEIRFEIDAAPKMHAVDRYEFQNKEGTSGIALTMDFISLHTSKYEVYGKFEETLSAALTIIHQVVSLSLVERIGLRYIDLIRLSAGEKFSDYLQPGLLGLEEEKLGVQKSLSRFELVGITDVGKLVVRYSQSDNGAFLPADLMPSSLKHDVQIPSGEKVAFLDLDHFAEESHDFETVSVLETLGRLHENLDRTFRSAVTATALQKWGSEAVS
jgi:uncharacterized protein (TIGR04255 family)